MGDFNARLQEPDNEEEAEWIGPHTYDRGKQQSIEVENNKERPLDTCRQFNMIPTDSLFQKPPATLATWTKPGTQKEDPYDRQHYDQIDYILTTRRWRNGFRNVESELRANIDSDHAPVTAITNFKFKKIQHTTTGN